MKLVKDSLVVILLLLTCLIAYQTWLVLLQVENSVDRITQRTDATITDARRVLLSVGGTAAELRKTAKEQRELFAQTTKLTNARLSQLGDVLTHFDENVNQGLLPAATKAIKNQDERLDKISDEVLSATKQLTEDLHNTTMELKPTLQNLAVASEGAAKIMGNPSINEGIDATAKTAENVEQMSAEALKALKRAVKPANLAYKGIMWVWDNYVKGKMVF